VKRGGAGGGTAGKRPASPLLRKNDSRAVAGIRFYLDEQVARAVASGLRRRGDFRPRRISRATHEFR
jgi:hypothetical protein